LLTGSFWQPRRWGWQWIRRTIGDMTGTSISNSSRRTDDLRWRSIRADLGFWSVAGAVVAILSGPLSIWWSVPRAVLLVGGVSFLVGGVGLLFGLNRVRPTSRGLVWAFGLSNLLLAPIVWTAASIGVLPLSVGGQWALATVGVVALVLGVWQLTTLPRHAY
jgi:hypothetical protein